jgi:predicted nucleic acid-binding Zn ribbon protein
MSHPGERNRAQAGLDPALRQIIAGFRNSETWDEELDLRLLQALWPHIAGSFLARNTSVAGVAGQRVVVRVPDATWKRQLRSIGPALLRKVNEPWPGSRFVEIRFVYEDHSR